MADILDFPRRLLLFAALSWQIVNVSRSGGRSIVGTEQVVGGPSGNWTASLTLNVGAMAWNGSEELLVYRGFLARLRGRSRIVDVPYFDGRGPSQMLGIDLNAEVPYDDGAFFDDGAGYLPGSIPVSTVGAIAINAVEIKLTYPAFTQPHPGQVFTFPDGWMHQIGELIARDGNVWTVRISPWTRAAYPAGTSVEVDRPTCRMRLATDESGAIQIRAGEVWSAPTLDLVEAF